MGRKIKKFLKVLLALVAALLLLVLAGLWRLSLKPVQFGPESPFLHYVPNSIQFSQIFLRVERFYTIPELELRDVRLSTQGVQIKTAKLFATWDFLNILKGDFKISSVRLSAPEIIINNDKQNDVSIGEQLKSFFADIPVKYLELTQAKILFHDKEKTYEIYQSDVYILKFTKGANFQMAGSLKLNTAPPFNFKVKGRFDYASHNLNGNLSCNQIVLADLPMNQSVKDYMVIYREPVDIGIIFNYYPKTEDCYFNGWIKFMFSDLSPQLVYIKGEKNESGRASLTITSPRLVISSLPKIWLPIGLDVRSWVFNSIPSGVAQHVNLTFMFQKNKEKAFDLADMSGDVEIIDASVSYIKTLPSFEKVTGHVSFNKEKVSILVRHANMKNLQIVDSEVYLSGLQDPTLVLDGKIHFSGPFPTLIWYLNHNPLKKHLPGAIEAYSGDTKGQVHLSLPLQEKMKDESIILDVETSIKNGDFSLQYGAQKFDLKKTNLTLQKNPERLKISGGGTVGGFKSTFLWEEDYQPGALVKSKKSLNGSGEFKGLLEILPPFFRTQVHNPKGGEVVLSFASEEDKDGLSKVDLDMDCTNASIILPAFNWAKPKGMPAKLEIDLETRNNRIQKFKKLSFVGKGLTIKGNARFNSEGKVSEIYFKPFIINGAQGEGKAFLKDGVWEIVARAPFLNFHPILETFRISSNDSKNKNESLSLNLNLKIDSLFFKKGHAYTDLEVFSKIRNNEVHFLKVKGYDGGDPVSVRYEPHEENMVLEVEMPRLETLLKGLDISEQVTSQKVQIQAAKPLKDLTKPMKGKLFIEKLHIKHFPTFAKLLNLISIEGLVRTLSGEGLVFNDNYAKFEYKDHEVALRRARIMNSSIGITAKGFVNLKKKTLDLEGVLVPANFLNQLLGNIPLIGTLLTGGKDQGLFSVSYSAKGSFEKLHIKSNPLGVLAPNILKSLFDDITGGKKPKPTLERDSKKTEN